MANVHSVVLIKKAACGRSIVEFAVPVVSVLNFYGSTEAWCGGF